ncbi:hypothetical protein CYY_004038 [Polysphondylium violaceum]|uniref:RecA family profile 1 domain-containing protein n=1 Tax=Polysphondylium violaceum TaxID=133409 RepID=A0A8J4PTV8_9MYCE|nr:hypothetical protein CYY_004038 [Polysphondylium violaceum]
MDLNQQQQDEQDQQLQQEPQQYTGLELIFYEFQLLGSDNVDRFLRAGFKTVEDILISNEYHIHKAVNIPIEVVVKILKNLRRIFNSTIVDGNQFTSDILNGSLLFSTGSSSLDAITGGGYMTGEIIEFIGPTSCGKTQICMQSVFNLSYKYQLNAIYIDSSGSFSSDRIIEMFRSNVEAANPSLEFHETQSMMIPLLERIKVYTCFDASQLMELLIKISSNLEKKKLDNNYSNQRMIVIDSIGILFSPIIGGKQTHGHYTMMMISRLMKTIANTYQITFILTNNTVESNFNNSNSANNNNNSNSHNKPALGEAWSAVANHRFMITNTYTNDELEDRSIYVYRSTRLKVDQMVDFSISSFGIS